jgi:hypothetical protein
MIHQIVVQKYSSYFQRFRFKQSGLAPFWVMCRDAIYRVRSHSSLDAHGRDKSRPYTCMNIGPVRKLIAYALVSMLALLITSCNWPGAQQTQQPDARLQSFHVLSARIIMLDTQAEVDGTLQNANRTDRFPYDVTVIATFYNRAGNVVGQAGGVAEDVYPGMTRAFILAGSVDSAQYSRMVVTVISLKERRIEKFIPTPSVVP